MSRCIAASLLISLAALGATPGTAAEPAPDFPEADVEFFEKEVRPLLVRHCYECHSADAEEAAGSLRLDSRAAILAGGDTGAAIEAGNPEKSLLIDAINWGELYEMPPKTKMPDAEIAVLTRWVKMGAPWPKEEAAPEFVKKAFDIDARKSEHWAWQPLSHPLPPKVTHADWPRDDIDRFILAKLEQNKFQPNSVADKRTWLRRVYFDLIGLPPTPAEIDAFLADETPQAKEVVVDRLLASPQYGEKWARHWLDLMRYGESRGHEFDYDIPNVHEYRDYVIRALNLDLPYDQFVIEHLAGDLLEQPRLHPDEQYNESILGTGFWHLGEWVHSPVDIRKDEADRFDNMVDVMGKSFMALTIACARCHDHKFDAISQADYYRQFGFLQSSEYRQVRFETMEQNGQVAAKLTDLDRHTQSGQNSLLREAAAARQSNWKSLFAAAIAVLKTKDADRAKIAEEHGVRVEQLSPLVRELQQAADNPQHPLHPFGKLASAAEDQRAELVGSLTTPAAQSAADMQQVIDFATATETQWRANGYAFGTGPQRIGQLELSAEGLPQGVRTAGAAVRDARWNQLARGDGVQPDQGRLSGWDQGGRTFRTPTFELTDGRVYYLVRGSGLVFAVIDSHRMINGPLHGASLHSFNIDPKEGPRWITQDLRDYQGHRIHLEFTPKDDQPLEVLQVAEGAVTPTYAAPSTGSFVAAKLAGQPLTDEALSAAFAASLLDAIGNAQQTAAAPLADWVVKNRALAFDHDRDLDVKLRQLAADHQAKQTELVSQIRFRSRMAPAMWDGSGENERVMIRGATRNLGDEAQRGLPVALGGSHEFDALGSGRLQMAQQMMSPDNPFASRVIVNRLWHHLTGRGIVASVDNFGVLGEEPTHPELLDYLSNEFIADGWSMKRMIRRIVLTQTYAMSSEPGGPEETLDPDNKLLHRMRIRRLTGEAIRDEVLAISGRLDRQMYGHSVPTYLTEFMQGRGRPASGPIDGNGRRSVYLSIRRNFLSPTMLAFDVPQPASTVGKRNQSNVPAQALILLNDPMIYAEAQRWGAAVARQEAPHWDSAVAHQEESREKRIEAMFVTALGRPPFDAEAAAVSAYFAERAEQMQLSPEAASAHPEIWGDVAHALFNVKDFIYLR
ncbi:PSD1 and planctomycete cytochrome C domain-containing protein [Blastopirellula sp. JC732]|uniref:PSD1 and planctomycete cytochrome C domain-containing protein n=1 Tax=Blastopirellula sediminis TaxID=2894196 RepID=A0A9X1MMH7_9BACT|nr:PSD1 and planctomycete cytochrome C domain-containing protein [Blastopirellula sediminis]MCC9607343.1 PSD1 and planctomycete cytochrome C domain-containing protein [Blastopirellula sediminis]MCC9629364.1 PSD1 and planctomycete cytochrome C domain-containing protein [Blastopirellula sediminis]